MSLGTVILIIGMAAILVVLGFIAGLLWRRGMTETKTARDAGEDPDEETIAVLAAAAAVMLKRPVSIRRVRFLKPSVEPAWAVTGRLNIMASHAISRRKSHS
jgi:hypothetical protein